MAFKIKKDDTVVVLSGKDRGKKGKVMACYPKDGKIMVEGVNMVTKHTKPRRQGEVGGRIETEGAFYACKVMPVCSKCGKATRVAYRIADDGKKSRICKKCGESLDQ